MSSWIWQPLAPAAAQIQGAGQTIAVGKLRERAALFQVMLARAGLFTVRRDETGKFAARRDEGVKF